MISSNGCLPYAGRVRIAFVLLIAAIGAFALLLSVGTMHHRRNIARLVGAILQDARSAPAAPTVRFSDRDALPAPVLRYFEFALREGQAPIRVARLHQSG